MNNSITVEITKQIEASIAVKQAVYQDSKIISQIVNLTTQCLESLRGGGKIVFAGNGGSFADAQHLSAEFTSRFKFDRSPLASLVLAANSSAISAIGNDYGFDKVFSRELEAVAKPGDIFIPITTSGNSTNIIESVKVANSIGLTTVCFTGATGGIMRGLCECICVPSVITAHIQECHIMLGHILCGLLENLIFKNDASGSGK